MVVCAPVLTAKGTIPATRNLLETTDSGFRDIEVIEINEAPTGTAEIPTMVRKRLVTLWARPGAVLLAKEACERPRTDGRARARDDVLWRWRRHRGLLGRS